MAELVIEQEIIIKLRHLEELWDLRPTSYFVSILFVIILIVLEVLQALIHIILSLKFFLMNDFSLDFLLIEKLEVIHFGAFFFSESNCIPLS